MGQIQNRIGFRMKMGVGVNRLRGRSLCISIPRLRIKAARGLQIL
jgi:hypothetical protein